MQDLSNAEQITRSRGQLEELIRGGGVDLHLHTYCSDGLESPSQLIKHVLGLGLKGFAITDHDTVDGNRFAASVLYKLRLMDVDVPVFVPGVEVSCQLAGQEIHLLGYWPDGGFEALEPWLEEQRANREQRNRELCDKLIKVGAPITYDELAVEGGGVVGRVHAANILVRKGFSISIDDCFDNWLGEGRPAYVARQVTDVTEALAAVREAGGVPVLAHPEHYGWMQVSQDEAEWPGLEPHDRRKNHLPAGIGADRIDADQLRVNLASMRDAGLEGVEVIHGDVTDTARDILSQVAGELGLLRTIGSDYHSSNKQGIHIIRPEQDYSAWLV